MPCRHAPTCRSKSRHTTCKCSSPVRRATSADGWSRLLARGHQVRCVVRDPDRLAGRDWSSVEIVRGDLADVLLPTMFEGIDVAYYLVHSMAEGGAFRERDRLMARAFARAAAQAGVGRIIYLGGLGRPEEAHRACRPRSSSATTVRCASSTRCDRWAMTKPSGVRWPVWPPTTSRRATPQPHRGPRRSASSTSSARSVATTVRGRQRALAVARSPRPGFRRRGHASRQTSPARVARR